MEYNSFEQNSEKEQYELLNQAFANINVDDESQKSFYLRDQLNQSTIKPQIMQKLKNKMFNCDPIKLNSQQVVFENTIDKRQLVTSQKFPFSAIGLLYVCMYKDCYGTAFLIKDNIALTAAHNVYSKDFNQFVSQAYLTFDMTSDNPKTYQVACAYVPKDYIQVNDYSKRYQFDYAVLVLNTFDNLSKQLGELPLAQFNLEQQNIIYLYGFPKDKNQQRNKNENYPNLNMIRGMFGCQGKVLKVQESRIFHNAPSSLGQSGSPIFKVNKTTQENLQYSVIGIHTGGNPKYNFGVLITKEIFQKIEFWLMGQKEDSNKNIIPYQKKQVAFIDQNDHLKKLKERCFKKKISDTRQVATQIYQWGLLQQKKNNYQQAMNLYLKSQILFQSINEKKSINYANLLHELGVIYIKINDLKKSMQCYSKSLQIRQCCQGKQSLNYSKTLAKVGSIHQKQKNRLEALKRYQESLKIKELIKGKQHYSCVSVINSIANLYAKTQNYDKAIQMYEKALQIQIKLRGQNKLQNTLMFNNLGNIYYFKKKNKQKGMQYFQKSLKIFKVNSIKKHYLYAEVLTQMGDVHLKLQKYKEALQYFMKSTKMFQEILGKNSQNKYYKHSCSRIKKISEMKINDDQ